MVFGKPITMSEIKSGWRGKSGVDVFGDEWRDNLEEFDEEPLGCIDYGEFRLVGHGKVTNEKCGSFSGYHYGCLNVHLHNKIILDGVNYAGKVFVKKASFHSCDKPSCPSCYKYGWAVREALSITSRLKKASRHFGEVEHIIATFPPRYWDLTYEQLRDKCVKILKVRGIVGGVRIFHGFGFNKKLRVWEWRPHFHVLGFVLGGFRKCRHCGVKWSPETCGDCNGFMGRTFRAFKKDGCVVKVKGERKTVGGTAWYQLNHASYKKGVKRFQIASWFGNVSTRKMKVTKELRKSICPICQHDLEKIRYVGQKLDSWFLLFARNFCVPLEEQPEIDFLAPEPVWVKVYSSVSHGYRDEELD